MIKRLICALFMGLVLSLSVSAASISFADKDFLVLDSENSTEIAEILGTQKQELSEFLAANNISYLAVNSDNSKQIRLSVTESSFSKSIINLSYLEDEKITELIPDIIGTDKLKGKIVLNGEQKFIKTEAASSDSGGEFAIFTYITVMDKKLYSLSVFGSKEDRDFADSVFLTFNSEGFYKTPHTESNLGYIMIAVIVFFSLAAAFIIYTIIRDLKKNKTEKEPE